eukprot:TRINITY_DN858_c0_g1_i2.p2 TRINITY_DN858_c0_g1~~TRINITY_DN858_c0_g1_i2.p2  ORF type:complete len:163 (+),score=42.99 TRINITY_DN858_c0_g1_i2:1472-1960(+)
MWCIILRVYICDDISNLLRKKSNVQERNGSPQQTTTFDFNLLPPPPMSSQSQPPQTPISNRTPKAPSTPSVGAIVSPHRRKRQTELNNPDNNISKALFLSPTPTKMAPTQASFTPLIPMNLAFATIISPPAKNKTFGSVGNPEQNLLMTASPARKRSNIESK